MKVNDYFSQGKRSFFRFKEKGGKQHKVPVHHNAQQYLDEYMIEWEIKDPASPLWLTCNYNKFNRTEAWCMVRLRNLASGVSAECCNHTFRVTDITAYLENGGALEKAQQIAAHSSTRTTKLYDRRNDELTLDEIERIINWLNTISRNI